MNRFPVVRVCVGYLNQIVHFASDKPLNCKNGSNATQLSRLLARPDFPQELVAFLSVVTAAIILANFAAQWVFGIAFGSIIRVIFNCAACQRITSKTIDPISGQRRVGY